MNPLQQFFSKVPLFAGLDPVELDDIVRCVRPQSLRPGQTLFQQGDASDAAFVVQSGAVEVLTRARGRDVLVATLGPGEVVGELALIDGGARSASVRATVATEVLRLDRAEFDFLRRNRRPAAFKVMFAVADALAGRIEVTQRLVEEAVRAPQRRAPDRARRPSGAPAKRAWAGRLLGARREASR